MYSKWTEHLKTEKEKTEFRQYVQGSRTLLDRLKTILDDQDKTLEVSELTLESYNQPNWAVRQAHKNGYRSCLRTLRKLVDLDQQITPVKSTDLHVTKELIHDR